MATVRLSYRITDAEHDDPASGWATGASETVADGFPVSIEGVDWQQACRDHGFFGAIQKVKAAHRIRKGQL